MFKAKLIKDDQFYLFRSKQLWFLFLLTIPIGILANFFSLSWPLTVGVLALYAVVTFYSFNNQKKLQQARGEEKIEIDENSVRITSTNGRENKSIKLHKSDVIKIPAEFQLPQESMKDIAKELKGEPQRNYLHIDQGDKKYTFDFDVDSYYMIEQLNKVIRSWENKGYQIHRV